MAKRIMKAQIKPVTCKLQIGVDYEITKPNLALTPQNIQVSKNKVLKAHKIDKRKFG